MPNEQAVLKGFTIAGGFVADGTAVPLRADSDGEQAGLKRLETKLDDLLTILKAAPWNKGGKS